MSDDITTLGRVRAEGHALGVMDSLDYIADAADEINKLRAEIERLRAENSHLLAENEALRERVEWLEKFIADAILDLSGEHQQDRRTIGTPQGLCQMCGAGDGDWPCVSAMVVDDLRRALGDTE